MARKDEILDTVDKHKGPRTCPECGYQFPFSLFMKRYVMKFGFPKWTCPSCRKLIKYNFFKSNLIGAVIFFAFVFLFQGLKSTFGWDMPDFIFMIPYFFLALLLLNRDTFEEYK